MSLFIDTRNAVGDTADSFVGDRFGEARELFGADLVTALAADYHYFVTDRHSPDMADVYHRLIHRNAADDSGALATDKDLGFI